MKSREERTEAQIKGNDNDGAKTFARRGLAQHVFHKLTKIFNGLHWAIGITTLPTTATGRDERSFVFWWLGLIAFMIVFLAAFFYFLMPLLA